MIKSFDQLPLLPPESTWRPPTEMPRLSGVKRLSYDVETYDPQLSELGPGVRRGGHIVGMSIGTDDGRRFYFPIRHQGEGNMDPALVMRWARAELNAFDGELVGANLIYDLDFSAEVGITFPNVKRFLDVQVAEPLIDENKLYYNLGSLAKEYLGEDKTENELKEASIAFGFGATQKEIKSNLWRLPAKYVGRYAEGDADLPLRILPLQVKKLHNEELLEIFDLESRLIPCLLAMRRRGVRVDVDKAGQVRERLVRERDVILKEVKRLAGPHAELMAPESFAKALMERGLPVPQTAKTGKPSVTKGWLKEHENDALVSAIMRGRRVNTIITTFIDGHVFNHAINGRIHCEFNQLKSDDGGTIARLSSSQPNLQNIPSRDDELGPMIRSLFIPEDGEDWSRCDMSQAEYRLLTHFAIGDRAEEARQQYRDDAKTDFHNMCAGMLGFDSKNKGQRTQIKSINFCKVYGGGPHKIASMTGLSFENATIFVDKYDAELPFIKTTSDTAKKRADTRGYIKTILGRRQRFDLWEPFDNRDKINPALPREQAEARYGTRIKRAFTYAALNRVLQGSAADQMKKSMVMIWEAGICKTLGALLLTVHDELDVSVPKTPAGEEALLELKRTMEVAIPLRVPVIAELEIGPSWGECK